MLTFIGPRSFQNASSCSTTASSGNYRAG
jgi:hypothetical protein